MTAPHDGDEALPLLGQGFHFEDLREGQQFRTFRRTITEADLVGFIGVTGMLEEMFIDQEGAAASIGGRPVPAALTYTLIEGLLLQTMIQGTGLALLEMTQKVHAPVRVNDSIHAIVTVTGIRPTSKGDRAVVDSEVRVINGAGVHVMTYTARRLLAGRRLQRKHGGA